MLSAEKFKDLAKRRQIDVRQLAGHLARGGLSENEAAVAISNWQKGLFKPKPRKDDIHRLASALGVEENDLAEWSSCCRYAPVSARKARLVTQLVVGRPVQDAMDILKFTNKRAAGIVDKVLKTAVADADEQRAEVDELYVSEARVDDAGIRIGTKRWIAKDRGRAHPIRKKACHVHVTVTQI